LTLAATFPGGIVAGNLIVLTVLLISSAGVAVPTTPAGFTLYLDGSTNLFSATNGQVYIFWKIAAGNDTGPTITVDRNSWILQSTVEVSSMNAAAPFDTVTPQVAIGVGGSATVNSPALVTNSANTLVVHQAASCNSTGSQLTGIPATSRYTDGDTVGSGNEQAWADEVAASPGTAPARTWTRGSVLTQSWYANSFAIAAPATGGVGRKSPPGLIVAAMAHERNADRKAQQDHPNLPSPHRARSDFRRKKRG
jgi:hypothetical protein